MTLLISLILLSIPVAGDSVLDTEYFGGVLEVDYNYAPEIDETSESPTDGSSGHTIPVTLEINVSDPEGDEVEVRFYDNDDDSLIGTDSCAGNRTASVSWSGLSYSTTYEWYIVVEECTHQGSDYDNTSSVFNFTTVTVTPFTETRYFGGEVEVDTLGSTQVNVWNSGEDYFCWKGDNGTLSDVAALVANFDEADEYVAVWNSSSWDDDDWCWIKYYGDDSGTDANVNQLDVIKIYMTDTEDMQEITMVTSDLLDCERTVDLFYTGEDGNKGYNYTCYCCDLSGGGVDVSDIADNIGLQTGEVVSWWDNSSQEWRGWIEGISHTDYDYAIDVSMPIFETKIHTDVSWVIECL